MSDKRRVTVSIDKPDGKSQTSIWVSEINVPAVEKKLFKLLDELETEPPETEE